MIEALVTARGLGWNESCSAQEQAEAVAAHIRRALQQAIALRGRASLALSGGRGPELFLRRLEQLELAWEKVSITQVDERWVPPQDAQSNARLIQQCMPGVLQRATWLPMFQGQGLQADAHYCHVMLEPLLPLDVVVLGMGPDGHTASLFPHMPQLAEYLSERASASCIAVPAEGERLARLSMTARAIQSARLKLLVIAGEDKRRTLASALGEDDPLARPITAFLTPPMDIFHTEEHQA